ncbi:Sugar or nucleoside kinase, ribokinase family [Chitinophaga sp. CF118]|uniref:PfkB family carbohydrate kinase n=1 Tax=Chitinophaga sp. CF118 TaxID=1884367 RepID=UPI0008ECFB8A|nr:PfkB family carbohydrate kinase [Chitinophaga sp. CF118]SFD60990.1 Sugar or nucleoside kinase, ribokinase family [Chitinophaga sp. CF118]
MFDICCIGHITLDTVITTRTVVKMAGGTSFYFSNAIRNMDVSYMLVTSLAKKEMYIVDELRKNGIDISVVPSKNTVYFENRYTENLEDRTQRVSQTADPITVQQLQNIDAAIYHLGPLLAEDIPVDVIKLLAGKGIVSLDAQGYLRTVQNEQVLPVDWPAKKEALKYVDILKANEYELEVLTGVKDVSTGAKILAEWGVKEVVVTLGSMGSVILKDNVFYSIPPYIPGNFADTTGCGDTYMAGYLCERHKGAGPQQAGEFASAMAGLKVNASGPFTGTREDVLNFWGASSDKRVLR